MTTTPRVTHIGISHNTSSPVPAPPNPYEELAQLRKAVRLTDVLDALVGITKDDVLNASPEMLRTMCSMAGLTTCSDTVRDLAAALLDERQRVRAEIATAREAFTA